MLRQATRGIRMYGAVKKYPPRSPPMGKKFRDPFEVPGKAAVTQLHEQGDGVPKAVKRRVAMVVSYVGTGYSGLQYSVNDAVLTVEKKLLESMLAIGAVLPSNATDPTKIGWSRSSRTDKGVHAARIILSMKLEIQPEWEPLATNKKVVMGPNRKPMLEVENVKYAQLVKELNAHLPPEIRVMMCMRVVGSFRARSSCTWREYEYVLPTEILMQPAGMPQSTDEVHERAFKPTPEMIAARYMAFDCTKQTEHEALDRLNIALNQFVGTQKFHNFHNLKARDTARLKTKLPRKKDPASVEAITATAAADDATDDAYGTNDRRRSNQHTDFHDEDGNADDEEREEEEDNGEHSSTSFDGEGSEGGSGSGRLGDFLHDEWAPVHREFTPNMRRTMYKVQAELRRTALGKSMISVQVRGDGFNLNQIRLMIGAAILTARGMVPPNTIQAALTLPYRLRCPMLPAEGLYLQYAGFGLVGAKYMALSDKSVAGAASDQDLVLLDPEEYQTSEQFKVDHIQPRILHDWYAEDSKLLRGWLREAEQYRPSVEVAQQWQNLLQEELELELQTTQHNARVRAQRIHQNIQSVVVRGRSTKDFRPCDVLPEGLYTSMVITFDAYPGLKVDLVMRRIANLVLDGKIPHTLTSEEMIFLIRQRAVGATKDPQVDVLDYWAKARFR